MANLTFSSSIFIGYMYVFQPACTFLNVGFMLMPPKQLGKQGDKLEKKWTLQGDHANFWKILSFGDF